MTDEERKQVIEIWKTIVDVQKHFNDISMRIRSMFITILLALFASVGFLLDKKLSLRISAVNIQFATLVPIFGVLGTYLFYFIDRYWYHRLLVGSVRHAITIEKKYKELIPELSLSDVIRTESPYSPGRIVRFLANLLVTHDKYRATGQLHSDGKIELFYKSVVISLILTAVMLAGFGGVTIDVGGRSNRHIGAPLVNDASSTSPPSPTPAARSDNTIQAPSEASEPRAVPPNEAAEANEPTQMKN